MEPTDNNQTVPPISIIIPAYNEENAIEETVDQIYRTMADSGAQYEIIVVDDCSTDQTGPKLETIGYDTLRIVRHSRNKGYGASLKTGVRAANFSVVAITDADGTYPNQRLPELAVALGRMDMIVGARTGKNVRIPLIRRPAKWCIGKLANYLARYKIPDINSGLRIFNRDTLVQFLGILPDGFSFTTTITLAMLTCNKEVRYIPIDYAARVGKSKIRPIRDTLNFVQLIIRTILLFEPLRIFLPVALLMFFAAVGVFLYSWLLTPQVMDMTTTLLFVSALQMTAIGMLADIINRRLGK